VPLKEAALMLGVHENTLYHYIKSGEIEYVRFSKRNFRFTMDNLTEFINKRRDRVKVRK
jgi:excisionase family DNA binding protein